MSSIRLMVWSAAALAASISASHAGSCSNDIDRMQARIDARVEAIAAAGPFVRPGIWAGGSVQPTPLGMATVEEKMGEVPTNRVDAVRRRSRKRSVASAAGRNGTCKRRWQPARHLIGALEAAARHRSGRGRNRRCVRESQILLRHSKRERAMGENNNDDRKRDFNRRNVLWPATVSAGVGEASISIRPWRDLRSRPD